ncbi:hypothetical protein VTO42DRAFT_7002 [Malbranchea cinnamomea]
MGNDNSAPVSSDTPPRTLESRTLEAVAKYIKEKDVRRIVVMTGAGISTSAGIPDFRSPDTGLYANLARLELPYPEAVFDISYFRRNPRPFYALSREMYPGRFRPTLAHSFIKLLHDKGRLLKLFTQNIDCLEREAGLPSEMIVEAHGSFATQSCIDCKAAYPTDRMKEKINANEIPLCLECMGLVKPDIVFFGEALPSDFFLNRTLPATADLCIIMGTSLTVQPFASLPSLCRPDIPRVLINLELAGDVGSRLDDVLILGECDAGVTKLAEALGWKEDLEALWAQTAPATANPKDSEKRAVSPQNLDERLHAEIEKLTEEVDQVLHISRKHDETLREKLKAQTGKADIRGLGETQDKRAPDRQSDDSSKSESGPTQGLLKSPDVTNSRIDADTNKTLAAIDHTVKGERGPESKKPSSL